MPDANGYWFRSDLFRVEPGEDEETNPGRYGRQLARWIADRLRARGVTVESVTAEDWGWRVGCRRGPHRLVAACGNVDDTEREGALPAPPTDVAWHCFPVVEAPFWRRLLRGRDVDDALASFNGELRAIFEGEPRIRLIEEP
jgi:hypothetical protein